jgi:hypothetical protein
VEDASLISKQSVNGSLQIGPNSKWKSPLGNRDVGRQRRPKMSKQEGCHFGMPTSTARPTLQPMFDGGSSNNSHHKPTQQPAEILHPIPPRQSSRNAHLNNRVSTPTANSTVQQ